jgi:LmbE family N-acetylglucosaminyl deacetylase
MVKEAKKILGKRIVVITAHPDDESYSAAGLIYKNSKMGGRTFLICATLGEKGMSHLKKPVSAKQLMVIRKKELAAAAKYLGIKEYFLLGLNDGKVKSQKAKFYKEALSRTQKIKPDYILSFGKDGVSGHHDHVTAGSVAAKVSKTLKIPLVKFAASPFISKNGAKWFKKRRTHKNYTKELGLPVGNIKLIVPKGVKLKALRCYPSQIDGSQPFTAYPPVAAKNLIDYEYFVG